MRIEICTDDNYDELQQSLDEKCHHLKREGYEILDIRVNTHAYRDSCCVGYITFRKRGE